MNKAKGAVNTMDTTIRRTQKPWYQWAHRWNQVNSVENDPRDCDLQVWRKYWRENRIQGTIVNAAGTVGYFPSQNPYQYRAKFLGDRDYFADFCKAAREEGLVVVARMDSNQATEAMYHDHPEWFAKDAEGQPIPFTEGRYYTCVNSGYFTQQLASVIREIIEKYHPDAFADNSWAGGRGFICYCENCRKAFAEYSGGLELPKAIDYNDRAFRLWMEWNRQCRKDLYAWFNELTMKYGGQDCVYMGMLHPDAYAQSAMELIMDNIAYADYNKAVMIDGQARQTAEGYHANSQLGLTMRETFGEDTLVIESVATYYIQPEFLRKSAYPNEETSMWMRSGMSSGISPSCHFIGGVQEDRRTLENGHEMYEWHYRNEAYLYNRRYLANVGLVRSMTNTCNYGGGDCELRTVKPMTGMVTALRRGRISYFPVDTRQIMAKTGKTKLLILPEIAAMTDEEMDAVAHYIRGGGSVVLTGATGMLDRLGYARKTFPLDDLLGIERLDREPIDVVALEGKGRSGLIDYATHNYIRIDEPRHPIFKGFEKTAIIGLHGVCYKVRSQKLKPVAHLVPAFPTYPPEVSYMEDDRRVSGDPAILCGETGFGGRVVYFAADYDRRYAATNFPDYGDLLVHAIVWALGEENLPFTVTGKGELDCKLYAQQEGKRLVMHMVNYSGLGKFPACTEEFYPVGPQWISINTKGMEVHSVCKRSDGTQIPFRLEDGRLCFMLDRINDQELIVIE